MIKDIGSIFSLSEEERRLADGTECPVSSGGRVFYSLCREALYDIARLHDSSRKVALVPAYTCMTVAAPLQQLGWQCVFYNINRNLRIDTDSLLSLCNSWHPTLVIAHPYYGMDFNVKEEETLATLHKQGCHIVVDLTQCIYSRQRHIFVDYYIGSLRKWLAMPDGGFLETGAKSLYPFFIKRDYNTTFATKQADAMYLRGLYFEQGTQEVKDISRRINQEAVLSAREHTQPHRMAPLSFAIMQREDMDASACRRMDNCRTLNEMLTECSTITPVCDDITLTTSAPLYYVIYTDHRSELQRHLATERIYAPVIWPLGMHEMLVSEDVAYIYGHILALPVDQRYDQKDMTKMAKLIQSFCP